MHVLAASPEIEEQKRLLMRRVLASQQFVHAESLQRILQFLFERARHQDDAPVKEYEIAVHAVNRPESFDPKLDAIIRVSIASIRERLRAYFENEGRKERWTVAVPKGQYRLQFVEARDRELEREPEGSRAAMLRFWSPYVLGSHPNILLYTELLCFRDLRGNYFRNIYVNDAAAGAELAAQHLPESDGDILPSFHFVSGGEMLGVLSLVQGFHEMRCSLQVKNSRFVSWGAIQSSNLVIVGSARTNSFVRQLQAGEKLVIRDKFIEDCEARGAGTATYQSSRFLCGSLERVSDYALVTRRPGPVVGTCVTLIAANHGRAMEGAVQFLIREDKVRDLLDVLVPRDQSVLPDHFQVLLRVEMVDYDEEVFDIQYVTHKM
jgi:hypothetical protein